MPVLNHPTSRQSPNLLIQESVFTGEGELGTLIRQRDWSTTPLGPIQGWPQALKIAVRIMLTSRQPMFIWWGDELINFYNDAYMVILGSKHPQALGQSAPRVWQEIWDQIGPRVQYVLSREEGTYDEALLLIMERHGYAEETYYTFSYSPIPNDKDDIGGIFGAITDDTQRIIGERQLALLQDLAARTANARTIEDACTLSAGSLATNPHDLPFALIYLLNSDHRHVLLAGTSGIMPGHKAAPPAIAIEDVSVWPFAEVVRTNAACFISHLEASLGMLPTGAWDRPPTQAVALPIAPSGQTGRTGILIVGLNPYRLLDDGYKRFLGLVSGQVAAAIANAQAYEEERKRAEALAEIDRAKTVFFSNVSHEFRTPLTLMLGPLEEILTRENGALRAERTEIELVHRNGMRLLKLVNTLLDFSRIEAGRVQATYEPTDLAAFTADLTSSFRSAIERAGLRLVVDCPPLPALVYVDRDMWEKIVLNLLSNAFKFTFAGKIEVNLKLSADGAQAELTVHDTGTGISADELPRLFERFHRIEGARGRTQEGTGIGLALVQELVKLHGGHIAVMSEVDRGSAFTVRIPFGVAHLSSERIGAVSVLASTAMRTEAYVEEALRWLPEEIANNQPLPPPTSRSPTFHPRSPARVLLADDNADMRDYVQRLLSAYYDVTAVANGQEALVHALGNPPDLVLSDVMMPLLDGFGLLKALRNAQRTRTIPVVLLTAHAGEEARVEGLTEGADDYIVKPFNARELLARVSAHIELARLRQEAAHREQRLRSEAEAARKQAEQLLRQITDSENRYRLIAYATSDALWERNLITGEAHWTGALQVLFGYDARESDPDTVWWSDHIHPEDRERVRSGIDALIKSGEQFWSDEYRFRRRDETYVYILDRGYVMHDEAGTPVRMVGAMIDLTARRQAEEASLRLASIVESSEDAIISKSLDGVVTSWNAAAERIFGYRAEEMIGQPILHLLPEDRHDEERIILERLRRGEHIHDFETIRQTKDGRLLDVSITSSPIRNEHGTIIGASKIARDITMRKQAEERQARLLTEVQRVNEELQHFAHIVSHDLNEPLRTMSSFVTLLGRKYQGKLDATADEYIAFVTDAARRIQQMLADLLTYTRMGGQKLTLAPVDGEALLARVLTDLQLATVDTNAEITHDPLPTVQGDATSLGQVLQNLLGNALKFRGLDLPRIHVSAQRDGNHWRFSVRDNGIGIDPKQNGRLFQVFQRLNTPRAYPGTGIGLAICKKIVERHGGRIWVESTPGKGATFFFTLHQER